MSYHVVLFDLDHTLLDSDASLAGAFERTMTSVGVERPADLYDDFDRINQALWRRVEAHEISPNDVRVRRFEELNAELGIDADAEEMADTFVDGLVERGDLFDGARELLSRLSAGHRLALVTNGIGRVQRGRLARLGLDETFDAVVISGEIGASKPGREIFRVTFDQLGLDLDDAEVRADAVMIGDNPGSDIAGGAAAGVDTILYDPASDVEEAEPSPTHRVTTFDEIAELVTRSTD